MQTTSFGIAKLALVLAGNVSVLVACSPSPAPADRGSTPTPTPKPSTTTPITTSTVPAASPPMFDAGLPSMTPPPAIEAGTCAVETGSPTCDQCIQLSCCGEAIACQNDPDCLAMDACMYQCMQQLSNSGQFASGEACEQSCSLQHVTGAAMLEALSVCANTRCYAQCQ